MCSLLLSSTEGPSPAPPAAAAEPAAPAAPADRPCLERAGAEPAPGPAPADVPLELLEREITQLAAHLNAATCRWLGLVGDFDRREGWAEWGCKSCAHWLSYRCGLSPAAAREHVRVARRMGDLPQIRSAFARGELCYSQVRAVTRVATPDTDGDLVEIARHATASQLETVVRAYRGVLSVELGADEPAYRRRFVRCEHDDDGSLLIRARLPAEEGALVLAALEAGRDALAWSASSGAPTADDEGGRPVAAAPAASPPGDPGARAGGASAETTQIGDRGGVGEAVPDGEEAPGEREAVSNADALVLMAQTLLGSGPAQRTGADDYQVVVHVDAGTLDAGAEEAEGACGLEGGPALATETVRRLACDASVVRILERDGRPLSVGRKTRSVPPALRRALRSRDRTCRFPGCCQRRFLHAHHIDHWADGGRTDLSNLIHLCRFHHRLVHEGGYTLIRRGKLGLQFRRPDGRAIPAVPARPAGKQHEVPARNRRAGLNVDDQTCVPRTSFDRFRLAPVVDGLAEVDPRLRE